MMSMEFFIDTTVQLHYGPGVNPASSRKKHQKYCLGERADSA